MLQLDAVGLLGHLSQAVGGAVDMGVAPLFAGPYKLRFSLWGFTWNKGRIEPAPSLQYATVWATPDISNTLSKSVGVMTAPSLEPHEQEITTWLEPREFLVFDPVSVRSRFLGDHKQEMVEVYVKLVEERLAVNECFEDAMRRAYVAVLTSPDFLERHDASRS